MVTREGCKTFSDDLEEVDLIDISLESFYEIVVEGEGDFAFDFRVVDELEDIDGELIP